MSHGKTDAHAGHCPGFAEGLHHQQVLVFLRQRQRRRPAEIDVGLVHDHHHVPVVAQDVLHLIERHENAVGALGLGNTTPPFS